MIRGSDYHGVARHYSVSVTDPNKCRPVLDVVEDLPEHGWTDIGMGESATWVRYRPARWQDEQGYVVVRAMAGRQGELFPRLSVILANRDDLPLAEVVRRHRSKQGHENAFKGPLGATIKSGVWRVEAGGASC